MLKKSCLLLVLGVFALTVVPVLHARDLGNCRVHLINGSTLTGQVEKTDEGYRIVRHGITTIFPESQVLRVEQLDTVKQPDKGTPDRINKTTKPGRDLLPTERRPIREAEIESLLAGIEVDRSPLGPTAEDMLKPVDADEESVQDMLRLAGEKADVLETDHFVLVYTSSRDRARQLAARLESVYRWNVILADMLNLTSVHPPDHKLETFFFGHYDEFAAYSANLGMTPGAALGYYHRIVNRSCYFDMMTYPPTERELKYLEENKKNIPYEERFRRKAEIDRSVDWDNLTVIQHEAGHHIHFNIGFFPKLARVPTWLVEGMTMMFEVPPSDQGASLGALNHGRLREFRFLYGQNHRRVGDLRMFILGHYNGGFGNFVWQDYCLGWALVYYLWSEHREALSDYMNIMGQREEEVWNISHTEEQQTFEDLFGEVDEDWIKEFYEFMNNLQLKTRHLPKPGWQ